MAIEFEHNCMDFQAYLILDQNSPDVKYEYIDGYAVAMADGTLDHSALGANVVYLLKQELGTSGPCRVYNSDARVKLDTCCFYPDAVITCNIADRGSVHYLSSPHLVVEVLSPSTEHFDRIEKFRRYQEAETLQEYVLVNYRAQFVEVFQRKDGDWVYRSYRKDEVVELASLDIQIAVNDLYAGLNIPEQIEEKVKKPCEPE